MDNTIVVVEPNQGDAAHLGKYLAARGWDVHRCDSAKMAIDTVTELNPRAVFIEHKLPDMTGDECACLLRVATPDAILVAMSDDGGARPAVRAFKAGASDYLVKPLSTDGLAAVLKRLATSSPAGKADAHAPSGGAHGKAAGGLSALLGKSNAMEKLRVTVKRMVDAANRLPDGELPAVLINGETGTGKELVARALHFEGPRRNGPFIEINCTAIPAHLLEAELFGHQRGAFTDAKESRIGLVEAADGGTLFLDEVGEIEISVQAKLLKLLEDKTIRPLGSIKEKRVNVQIISATNRDLGEMVGQGKFRSDLLFRLRILSLSTPPLRERGDDVIDLAAHFLSLHGQRYGKPALRFSAEASERLRRYSWPGNIREMRNMLEQTALFATAEVIEADQLLMCSHLEGKGGQENQPPEQHVERKVIPPQEHPEAIRRMLEVTHWNVSKTARLLGLTRDVLRYRMEQFQLTRPEVVSLPRTANAEQT